MSLESRLRELIAQQRAQDVKPHAPLQLHSGGVSLPDGGTVPKSDALLERMYEGDFVPREKKPFVVDVRRSFGPYLRSVDEHPVALLDAAGQIATLTHGFSHPGIRRAAYEGRFDGCLWANPDTRVHDDPTLVAYGAKLIGLAPAGLSHACFVGAGGAEANEKAFRMARMVSRNPKAKRVLAFAQGFHGRTFVSLMATSNPKKRGPFELPGYEAVFCERTLEALDETLEQRGDEVYAAILEPMMAEGGDVYLEPEFVAGVLARLRARGIPLIVDEVQTGFHTGGTFFWWSRFGLGDTPETSPDFLTCAKKAGLGVVLSRFPDPEPSAVNVISAARGLVQLETAHEGAWLEQALQIRLDELAKRYPEQCAGHRVAGTTFAFDMSDAGRRDAFIKQRFARGYMTYGAGERTVRFRISAGFHERALDDLFARIATAIERVDDPEAPTIVAERGGRPDVSGIALSEVDPGDWESIMALQNQAYEPARADTREALERGGFGYVARDADGSLLGYCFGGPMERYAAVEGLDRDPQLGQGRVFYSADVTVAEAARGRGVGRLLKTRLLEAARAAGFEMACGRNRVGATGAMGAINASLGAYVVRRLDNQYGEPGAQSDYYKIPLVPLHVARAGRRTATRGIWADFASGIQAPLGADPDIADKREWLGPLASRLNLSNWVTVDTALYAEHLRALAPRGTGHMYVTSSRDELVDKSLRCIRLTKTQARICVGLEGGYFGQITAASRSLSDPAGFGDDFGLFEWPRIPHPAQGGVEATVAALEAVVAEHGPDAIFGLYVERVGERSGWVLDGNAARALREACTRHGLPFVVAETASGCYRSGEGAWGIDAWPEGVSPDFVLWHPGGQLGHIFVSPTWFIKKPLTLISTWDGDQISMMRVHEHLRAAVDLDLAGAIASLEAMLVGLAPKLGATVGGLGLFRTLRFADEDAAAGFVASAREAGVALGRGAPSVVVFAPPLDVDDDAIARVAAALEAQGT